MAISTLTIIQDHVIPAASDLLCVHSPLVFIIDAEYSGVAPDYIYASIYDVPGTNFIDKFKMIPYLDVSSTHRQFIFISDSIVRGLMEDFPDFVQTGESLVIVEDITKRFAIKFHDPDEDASDIWTYFTALIATRQFGKDPNAVEIFDNDVDTYIGAANKPVYVYFYNDDANNTLTVEDHIHYVKSQSFTRNNCIPPATGSTVTYTKTYTSYVSKADLDIQVAADAANYLIEGQAYANLNGTCTLPPAHLFEENFDNWSGGMPVGWINNVPSKVSVVDNSNR